VSHVVTLSATATDNVGVTEVEFFVDGFSVGFDTAAPYQVGWNSTAVVNGEHFITAVARDAAGNETLSSFVSVNVVNPAFVNEVVAPGISVATTIAFLPDGRMLVGELTNRVLVVQPGASQPDPLPLLDLDYTYQFGEQGLMDIAVDPNFSQNGFIYIYYTKGFPGAQNRNRLSRFSLSGNSVVPGSETVLWDDDQVANHEHHAGAIAFGNDGKIYFTTGDQFVPSSAQQLNNYWGKVLRINPDGSIPFDNPFHDGAGPNKDAIWAYGLRNPYRISIDPVTGRMYIGDVGGNDASNAVEELNLGIAGANYGWPLEEGSGGVPGATPPIYSYHHNDRDAAITAGFVYRGSQFPSEYQGSFFFGDYAQNTIRRLTFDGQGNVAQVFDFLPANGNLDELLPGDVVKLIEGPDGCLYYIDIGFDGAYAPNAAAIRRIRYVAGNQPPVVVAAGEPTTGLSPLQVGFSSAGTFDPEGQPLSYLWNFGDGATSTQANPSHTYAAVGPYVATLRVSDGFSFILSNTIDITVGTPPTPTILGPADGTFFRAGDAIAFSATATDPEDATLPASAYSWEIRFHHEGHVHPAGVFTATQSGVLTIPTSGHDFQGDTSYEIVLFVTDSSGLTSSTSVTVYPEKVNLSFTAPPGLVIQVDGISRQTPFVLDTLIGYHHTIAAVDQVIGNTAYAFVGWSDGGSPSHEIVVPTTNQNYVATFVPQPVTLPGDYNADTAVNAADYVAWRKLLGSSAILRNDTTPGSVGAEDRDVWTEHFGEADVGQGQLAIVAGAGHDNVAIVASLPLEIVTTPPGATNKFNRPVPRSLTSRNTVILNSPCSLLLITRSNSVRPEEGATRLDVAKTNTGDGSETAADEPNLGAIDHLFEELGELRTPLSQVLR
jgi:glucose/arabinose dehydrogenase/PKD repeat protein